jgi:hypothetical protein
VDGLQFDPSLVKTDLEETEDDHEQSQYDDDDTHVNKIKE